MNENKQPQYNHNGIVVLTEKMVEQEISLWTCMGDYRFDTSNGREAFETGFKAGIAFACRSMPTVPCFCGCHTSTID